MDPIFLIALVPAAIFFSVFWTELRGAGWQPAPRRAIDSAIKLANVRPGDVFYDLGAGDEPYKKDWNPESVPTKYYARMPADMAKALGIGEFDPV